MTAYFRRPEIAVALALALLVSSLGLARIAWAEEPATDTFQATWARSDRPIVDLQVSWTWGPEASTEGLQEPYQEAEGGQRLVQYFDKARMEEPVGEIPADSPWQVTNGLLPVELMTGRLQLGDDLFQTYFPAAINVAGDPNDPDSPSYAEMAQLMDLPATESGTVITATIDGEANPGEDESYADHGVTADYYVEKTDHTIASIFWQMMNSEGPIYVDGQMTTGPIFPDPFFAYGYPVTDAYWTNINVGGEPQDVLIQVFERRVATYTPSNPEGWQVETGNVGQHYFEWRYVQIPASQEPDPTPTETPEPTPTPSPTPTDPADDCVACDLEYARGEIGTAGEEPLGEPVIAPLAEPYSLVPKSLEAEELIFGASPTATMNRPKTFTVIADVLAEEPYNVFYVADFNDGSVYVSDLMDAHYGLNITHTWVGRGTFYVKIWAIDPERDIRTTISTVDITVE